MRAHPGGRHICGVDGEGRPLRAVGSGLRLRSGLEAASLTALVAPYAVYRVIVLIKPLASVLEDVTAQVMAVDDAQGRTHHPCHICTNFVQFAWFDKRSILRKKVWP
jgi:hypothetical protein